MKCVLYVFVLGCSSLLMASSCPFFPAGSEEAIGQSLKDAMALVDLVTANRGCKEEIKTSAAKMRRQLLDLQTLREREAKGETVDEIKLENLLKEVESGTQLLVELRENCDEMTQNRIMNTAVDLSWAVMALAPEVAVTTRVASLAGVGLIKKIFQFWDPNRHLERGKEDLKAKALYPKLGCIFWDLQNKKLRCDKDGNLGVGDPATAPTIASAYGVAIQATQPFFKDMMKKFHSELTTEIGMVEGADNSVALEKRFNESGLPLYQACALLAGTQIIDASAVGVAGSQLIGKGNLVERNLFDVPLVNPPNHRDDYERVCSVFRCPDNPLDKTSLHFVGDEGFTVKEAPKTGRFIKRRDEAQQRANEAATFAHLQCNLITGYEANSRELRNRYINSREGSFCRIPLADENAAFPQQNRHR